MARLLVHAHDGLLGRAGREAEDLAGLGIEPGVLVVDAFLALVVEVALVGFGELLRAHAEEPVVDIHELRHRGRSPSVGPDARRPSCARMMRPRDGRRASVG